MSTTRTRPVLIPVYMKEFHCIGPACEDNCCALWRVDIDRATYKEYNKVRDAELRPMLDKHIKRTRENASDRQYAHIQLRPDGWCPFVTEEKLCRVQRNLGEQALSEVCALYPRRTNIVNGVYERAATLSCPEIARLVLLKPQGIDFEESVEPASVRTQVSPCIATDHPLLEGQVARYLWELRFFTISVLQNREYRLADRLIILGMFYQKLQQYVVQGRLSETAELIKSYVAMMADGGLELELASIPAKLDFQMRLAKELTDERAALKGGIHCRRYHECLAEFLIGIQCWLDASHEEIVARYQAAARDYYLPFMNEREYLLENYLVNHVFRNLFPMDEKKGVFGAYVMLVVHYAIIKMHLVGMAAFHKGLTEDLVVKLVQSTAKTFEHNTEYAERAYTMLHDSGFDSMAVMAMLIKD